MADTPALTPEQTAGRAKALEGLSIELGKLAAATQSHTGVISFASDVISKFGSITDNVANKLRKTNELSALGKASFEAFGLSVMNAQTSFQGFAGIDTTPISTFSGTINDFRAMLDMGGDSAAKVTAIMGGLEKSFYASGGTTKEWADAVKAGAPALLGLTEKMFAQADVGIRMQESQRLMAASTGDLGHMSKKAGDNLSGMTEIINEQNKMIRLSAGATNTNKEKMQEYYFALGKVRGALSETVAGHSMLTATVQLAHGTGMQQIDITNGMHEAYKKFGMTGADSIRFIARFSELSEDLGADLDDVKTSLVGATDGFKGLVDGGKAAGKMTEGVTLIMKEYAKGFEATGMGSKNAIEAAQNMVGSINKLGVAQRAFLSAQTGGPGGLMGGAQIEQMLRKGDMAGVQKMVMATIEKQTGKAVTLEEATKSEAAAATRQRQIALIQQGPLGSMANTPEDAGRLLEIMRAKQEGRAAPTQLRERGLETAMKEGSKWEAPTHTIVSDLRTELGGIQDQLAVISMNTVKGLVTAAAVPHAGAMTEAESKYNAALKESQKAYTRGGAKHATTTARKMPGQRVLTTEKGAQIQKESVVAGLDIAARLPDSAKRIASHGKKAATGLASAMASYGGESEETKERASVVAGTESRNPSVSIPKALDKRAKAVVSGGTGIPSTDRIMDVMDPRYGQARTPASAVAAAPRGQAGAAPTPARGTGATAPQADVIKSAPSGRFKVEVKVTEINPQKSGTSPAP